MSTFSTLLSSPRPSPPQTADEQALGLPAGDGETRLFRGRSIDELIPRIEAELGLDAIVVRRRRGLEGGIGGFFQRPYVEIEARPGGPRVDVYDEDPEPALPPALQNLPPAPQKPLAPAPPIQRPTGAYVTDTLATIAAAGRSEATVEDPPPPAPPGEGFRELTPDTFGAALAEAISQTPPLEGGLENISQAQPLESEFEHASQAPRLESELEKIDGNIEELHVTRPPAQPTMQTLTPQRPSRARVHIERGLIGLGVSMELTQELIDSAIAHALPFAPRIGLARAVHGAIVARIPVNPLLPPQRATVAVVGPGGAGKTSCCAALLGAYRRAGTLPASCASILLDPEREQPSMLLSPHVMEPSRLGSPRAREALAHARAEGLLLLDLPALSPADRGAIRMIASLLEQLAPDRVVVALPATLGAKAAEQLLEALRPLRAGALAITHADETDQLGVAVEAACRFGLAPEYLLDRGRVRGGLTRIDPTHLADRLMPKI